MKVLGISGSLHDSSVCLLEDGEVLFAGAEERWSRQTHDGAVPLRAIERALAVTGTRREEISVLAVGWSSPQRSALYRTGDIARGLVKGHIPTSPFARLRQLGTAVIDGPGLRKIRRLLGPLPVHYVDHHRAHALSAACCSGFEEATVVVADGRGAFEASSIWHFKNNELRPVEIIRWPNSIGLFYSTFTAYLGFKPLSDEWKVMGLAAWGKDGIDLSQFITIDDDSYQLETGLFNFLTLGDTRALESILGPAVTDVDNLTDRHKDIAFAVQRETEKAMLALVRRAIKKTGSRNLCMAGGVILNCKANGKILTDIPLDGIFIQPAAGDDGVSLGACMDVMLEKGDTASVFKRQRHSYFGTSYSDDEIQQSLDAYKIPYTRMENPPAEVAQLLSEKNIVGFFQGRMEFGPRALGCRSILADPRDVDMTDRVNQGVKFRESWRPFAPAVLEERYREFFDVPFDSPFMILSFPVKPEKQELIPAVVHVDGTARPQTVSRETNPYYWNVINEFEKITGIPVILNTSFNLKGEPIVESPFDAIRTFYTSGLDVLVLESFVIRKNGNS